MEKREVMENEEKTEAVKETKFTKEQILKCARYSGKRDILSVILNDGESYGHKELQNAVEKFLKGKVD